MTGFLSNIIENHDEPRGVSRYIPREDLCPAAKKMLAALYFMMRGIPFIYQGQELGMENYPFQSIEEVDDISTLDQYQVALHAGLSEEEALAVISRSSRDNARTPMQWDTSPNAGFTTGTPWLKVNPNYLQINAASQVEDPDSLFHFYRKLIALRKSPEYAETLIYGSFLPFLEEQHNLMAYYRKGQRTLLILANFQKDAQNVSLPAPCIHVALNNYPEAKIEDRQLTLKGYQVVALELPQSGQ